MSATLRREFEAIHMKDTETVDDFSMHLTAIVNNMRTLGDDLEEEKMAKKFLWVVSGRYSQVAIAIE